MFWKEKSVENMIILEGLALNSSMKNGNVPLVFLERSQ